MTHLSINYPTKGNWVQGTSSTKEIKVQPQTSKQAKLAYHQLLATKLMSAINPIPQKENQ
jgi:hypothetical protein